MGDSACSESGLPVRAVYGADALDGIDPVAGSYAIESVTGDIEAAALALIQTVDARGGAVAAIEQGFQKTEIEAAAYWAAQEVDGGARTVVGVNWFVTGDDEPYEPLRVDPQIEADQCERLAVLHAERQPRRQARAQRAAQDSHGYRQRTAADPRRRSRCATGGEIAHAPRDVWGVYEP